ncbi:hypothetical protein T484DRAFT_1771703 [Baffinella frigidus]|nr:hypothetical protein T484DRAFT_1771703 [Cryptophyta sp. CCMP2293]
MPSACADLRVAVVGASLGGLSAANMLNRLGANVSVFDYFPAGFHTRGGGLGAVDTDLLARIRADDVKQGYKAIRGHGHFYGDLWQYLYEGLPAEKVHFSRDIVGIAGAETATPRLLFTGAGKGDAPPDGEEFDLIIGADGGKSTIRPFVTAQTPSYSGYNLWGGWNLAEPSMRRSGSR